LNCIKLLRHARCTVPTFELVPAWSEEKDVDQFIVVPALSRPNRDYYPGQDYQDLFGQLSG